MKSKLKRLLHAAKHWFTTDIICSWCNEVKHRAPLHFLGDGKASHGVCKACAKKVIENL